MAPAVAHHPRLDRAVVDLEVPHPAELQSDLVAVSSRAAVIRRGSIRLAVADRAELVLAESAALAVEVPGFNENLGNTAGV